MPPPLGTASMLRKTLYGVRDRATLASIAAELGKDRTVTELPDESIESRGRYGIRDRVSGHGAPAASHVPPKRSMRRVRRRSGRRMSSRSMITPSSCRARLSHVVYFVPDAAKAETFYVERLGFKCTDRFVGVGPFLRPAANPEHHTLFLIQTPPFMKGCEHFTFHLGGPTELMQAGTRFANKGYQSFWGPGRHRFGSNWFWYFNSPLSCHVEYDADMDLHDESWIPREAPLSADASQLFLFPTAREMGARWDRRRAARRGIDGRCADPLRVRTPVPMRMR